MITCARCGTPLREDASACHKCGTVISATTATSYPSVQPVTAVNHGMLGKNRLMFVAVVSGMMLDLVLLFCPLTHLSQFSYDITEYAVVHLVSVAAEWAGSPPLALVGVALVVIGIVAMAVATLVTPLLLLRTGPFQRRNLVLAKTALLFSFIFNLAVFAYMLNQFGDDPIFHYDFRLTMAGWFYIIVSIACIIGVYVLSARLKTDRPVFINRPG